MTMSGIRPATAIRWLKFNLVGGIGIGVQLAALALFRGGMRMDYLAATALAVEITVIHNFLWHESFTWEDRPGARTLRRLAKFNLSTGAFSILGNLVLMKVLVELLGLPYLPANAIAIGVCSIANFLISDRFVFRAAALDHQATIQSQSDGVH